MLTKLNMIIEGACDRIGLQNTRAQIFESNIAADRSLYPHMFFQSTGFTGSINAAMISNTFVHTVTGQIADLSRLGDSYKEREERLDRVTRIYIDLLDEIARDKEVLLIEGQTCEYIYNFFDGNIDGIQFSINVRIDERNLTRRKC